MAFNPATPANRILTDAVTAADPAALQTAINAKWITLQALTNYDLIGLVFGAAGTDIVAYITYWSYNSGNTVDTDNSDTARPNKSESLIVTAASPALLATALTTSWSTLLNTKTNVSLMVPPSFGLDGTDYFCVISYQYYSAV